MSGCTLSPDGLAQQRGRLAALRGDVRGVERSPSVLSVRFGPDTDEELLGELIATERSCCSFLDIDYADRVLRISSDDPRDLDAFVGLLGEPV